MNSSDGRDRRSGANVMSELLDKPDRKEEKGGLLGEAAGLTEDDSFSRELEKALTQTVAEVTATAGAQDRAQSLHNALELVSRFQPAPWFIWRLSNFVFATGGRTNQANEGLVLGLRRLLFAAASDSVIGAGKKVNNVREALGTLGSDVVAAVAVMFAVNRKLASKPHERIWYPILEDAVLRAQLGFLLGVVSEDHLSAGRCMLAGYAGRVGLAIQIATGTLDQARKTLDMLASGAEIKDVGLSVYGCEPLHVSGMTLTASGVGRDAAFGTMEFSLRGAKPIAEDATQRAWHAAFSIIELARIGHGTEIPEDAWAALGFTEKAAQDEYLASATQVVRRGSSLSWLLQL